MNEANHNLVLVFHYSMESVREEEFLRRLIANAVAPDNFCEAHELAGRTRITRKKYKLLRTLRQRHLPAFHFLINKN